MLTVGNALEVVVCLGSLQVDANKLVVDLVLDVAEQDKSRHHAGAPGCLHPCLDIAVPHVCRRGQDRADGFGGHGEQDVAVVHKRFALADPIRLAGVAEILSNILVPVEGVHLVRLVLAYRGWDARVEREGHTRVATTKAEGANTALVILCDAGSRR